MNPQLCLMETGKSMHSFHRVWHGQLYFTFGTTPKAVYDYLFITRRLYILSPGTLSNNNKGNFHFIFHFRPTWFCTLCSMYHMHYPVAAHLLLTPSIYLVFVFPCLFFSTVSLWHAQKTLSHYFVQKKRKQRHCTKTSPCKAPLSSSHNDHTENSI